MHYFDYKNGKLYAEDVPLHEIVKKVGTPVYVYSYTTFERHFRVFDGSFRSLPHVTCYSCKANSNAALLRMVARMGVLPPHLSLILRTRLPSSPSISLATALPSRTVRRALERLRLVG